MSGDIGGSESLPESLRPAYDEMLNEIDREIINKIVADAKRKQSYGFQFAGKLVNAVRATWLAKDINRRLEGSVDNTLEIRSVSASRRGAETQLNVDCVLSRPVEFVNLNIDVRRNSLSVCQA